MKVSFEEHWMVALLVCPDENRSYFYFYLSENDNKKIDGDFKIHF